MSYSCQISFKQLPPQSIYPFLQKLKKHTMQNDVLWSIADENFAFSPVFRGHKMYEKGYFDSTLDYKIPDKDFREMEAWARQYIFTYRWFYIPEHQLLGVYSMNTEQQSLFDNTVEFQNSCDQNYDWYEWNGIDAFETLARYCRWAALDDLNKLRIKNGMPALDQHINDVELDYARKTMCYDMIWKMFEDTLYKDSEVVYLTLFAGYDFQPIDNFCMKVVHKIESWLHECEVKMERQNNEK